MAKPRNVSRRNASTRQPRKLILIVVEGTETEFNYFNAFKQEIRLTNISLEVTPSKKSDPETVVAYAHRLYKEKQKQQLLYDQVFCVVDGDHAININNTNNYTSARARAKKLKFEFIPSIPCFEIWFLLHFEYSHKPYKNYDELSKYLKKYIPNYDKNIDVFVKISDQTNVAIQNAKRLDQFHTDNGNTDELNKNPSTQVYRLVEEIIKQKQM